MRKIIVFTMLLASSALAYMEISLDDPMEGLRSNSIIEIVYDSSGIWLGTAGGVSYLPDGDSVWQTYTAENGLQSTEVSAMAFSIDGTDTILCVATLHTEYPSGESVPFGDGYSITYDKGNIWLDDTLTSPTYANYYGMLSYDIDMYQDDIYSANFYGGLVRSWNGGYNWDNLYLNASDSADLVDSTYRSYDNRYFSVKVDLTLVPDTISVWGGSASGLNRFVFTSYGGQTKQDSAWQFAHSEDDNENSLPGDHIVALATHGRPGRIYDMYIDSNYAYIAHDYEGMRIVDISNPDSLVEVGVYDSPGRAWAVYVDGNYAYLADYVDGVQILDISDPTDPTLVEQFLTGNHAVNVFVSGNYLYVADDVRGFYMYDISTLPGSVVELANYDDEGGSNDIYVRGDYAYLASYGRGLVILNIANPTDSVFWVGQYENDSLDINIKEVYVDSANAYLADATNGVIVLDITDPANPVLKQVYNTPDEARSIAYADGYYYVADGGSLHSFDMDISSDSLEFVTNIGTPGTALDVRVSGDYAYVADNYFGMQIYDISSPDTMALVGNYAPVCSTYIWAACRIGVGEDDQRYGVAYSPNYGKTWTTVIEEPAWDFAFIGDTIIVATDNGLYISGDYVNWQVIEEMEEVDGDGNVIRRYFPSGIYAVETVGSSIWAGGADGTVFTSDRGETWKIYRSQLREDEHFAYPSPFSPIASNRQGTTIHYMPPQTTDVTIKIFDFNLDLVATVVNAAIRQGGVESDNDVWDGRNDKDEVVANGVYFYQIKLGTGEDWWGKVAVVK